MWPVVQECRAEPQQECRGENCCVLRVIYTQTPAQSSVGSATSTQGKPPSPVPVLAPGRLLTAVEVEQSFKMLMTQKLMLDRLDATKRPTGCQTPVTYVVAFDLHEQIINSRVVECTRCTAADSLPITLA